MSSRFSLLTEEDNEKIVEDKDSQNTKGRRGEAVCWLREREKTERTWGKERVGTDFENSLCRSDKERIRSIYNKTIITFDIHIDIDIQNNNIDIQNNQDLSKGYQPQPSASADSPYLEFDYAGYHTILIQ